MPDRISSSATALDNLRPVLAAIPTSELQLQSGLDIIDSAGKVVGNLARIQALRGAALETFKDQGAGYFDRLPEVANAARQAGIEYLAAESDTRVSDAMAQLGNDHRLLVGDLNSLANRGLIERVQVEHPAGHADLINSTLVLVKTFRKLLPRFADSTGMKVADLDRIEDRADALFTMVNERKEGVDRDAANDLRIRALTHLIKEYGEVRRMVLYLRFWEGDADEIAPSLWSGRKRKKGTDEPPEPDPVPEPGPTGGPPPFTT